MAPPLFFFIFFISSIITSTNILQANGATWCVARSDASNQALQAALDYACGAGADCTPLLSEGLCFLPNTIQAHASYAFNSYFQKRAMAPGSCDFSGTATVARTDPSYGSCVYPSSQSTAGPLPTTNSTPGNIPTITSPTGITPLGNGGGGLNPPILNPPPTTDDDSKASSRHAGFTILLCISFWLLTSFGFPHN